ERPRRRNPGAGPVRRSRAPGRGRLQGDENPRGDDLSGSAAGAGRGDRPAGAALRGVGPARPSRRLEAATWTGRPPPRRVRSTLTPSRGTIATWHRAWFDFRLIVIDPPMPVPPFALQGRIPRSRPCRGGIGRHCRGRPAGGNVAAGRTHGD